MRIRHTAAMLTTAVLLALTGCSGDGEDTKEPAQPEPHATESSPAEDQATDQEAALENAVRDNSDAINRGDVNGYLSSLSPRCRGQITEAETRETMDLIDELYGDVSLQEITISAMTGTSAQVMATTGIQALDDGKSARWILEDGQWLADHC